MEKTLTTTRKPSTTDYLVLFLIGLLFYIDFLPTFRAIEVRGTQCLYLSILNFIITASFFCYPKFVNNLIIERFKKSNFIKLYFVFLIFCCLSFLSARNVESSFVTFSQICIITITVFNFCLLLFNRKHIFYKICFIIGFFTFIKAFSEINVLMQSCKSMTFSQAITTLKGNTGNINIFSASLNLKLPFLILGIIHFSGWKKWVLMLSIVLATYIILILDSRATILALLIEIIVIIIYLVWKSTDRSKLQSNIISAIMPIIFGIMIGLFSFSQASKNVVITKTTTKAITSKVGALELKDGGSVNQRLDYWSNASKIIFDKPFLGIGLGNWFVESIPYEKYQTNGMMISVHTHNDFLEIMSETGVLNGLVFFSLFVILLIINLEKIIKSQNELTKNIAFLCLLMLIGYVVDSFFNFPLYRPTVQLGLCFLIVFSLINSEPNNDESAEVKVFQWNQILLSAMVLLGLFSMYFSYHNFMALRLSNEIILDGLNNKKELSSDFILENYPKYPTIMFNSQPFAEYVGIYMVKEQNYELAKKYLKEADRINPYVGRVEWYQYSIAKATNKLDSAYIYAKKAFEKKPRNFDFFNTVIYMANQMKDTTTMLKTHDIYHKMVQSPKDYIATSSGLHNSGYSKRGLVKFIEKGLKEFPSDSLLLRRKKIFDIEIKTSISSKTIVAPTESIDISSAKRFVATEKNYDEVLKKAEAYGAKYLALAIQLGNENKPTEAIEAYKKVLETQPTNLSVKQNIGVLYYQIGQFKTAVDWLSQTTSAAQGYEDGKSEYIIAACYIGLKNNEKGCEYLNIAVAKNYTNAIQLQKQFCK
jgi:O-antigen ligase/tetratricopeptide (TPR) repeat protein